MSVGADIQFRIWSPVMSVVAVQDLNSSTRLTAQNAMTQSLSKKTVREIQTDRLKLGDYLGVSLSDYSHSLQPLALCLQLNHSCGYICGSYSDHYCTTVKIVHSFVPHPT